MTSVNNYIDDGWCKISFGVITVYVRIEWLPEVKKRGHFHYDFASFCLFYNGQPIVIDAGRYNYQNNVWGLYGRASKSHNTIFVDHLPIAPEDHYQYLYCDWLSRPRVNCRQNPQTIQLEIKSQGFNRLFDDNIEYTRTIIVNAKKMILIDNFTGHKSHFVQTLFHFAPTLTISNNRQDDLFHIQYPQSDGHFQIEITNQHRLQWSAGDEQEPLGWFFPEYGQRLPAKTLIIQTEAAFPLEQKYVFSWPY